MKINHGRLEIVESSRRLVLYGVKKSLEAHYEEF